VRARGLATALLLSAAVLAGALPSSAATSPEPLLRLQDSALLESSGLAVSTRNDGVLWTHADGGSVAQVRAVDEAGRTVAVVTLDGIDPYDPEALAPGRIEGEPALFLGDIGDNSLRREDVSVFGFREPATLADRTVSPQWYRFRYPDGPHDAEALLVHPRTGRIFIATKDLSGAGLYRAPRRPVEESEGVNRLRRVADVPSFVTDGAFLNSGRYVLRTYGSVYLYSGRHEQLVRDPLPLQPQGESIAVDEGRLLVGSEGERSAVYAVPIPRAEGEPAAPGSGDSDPSRPSAEDEWRELGRVTGAVAIALVLVALLSFIWRQRRGAG
jgi:hypothetical protein